jgi:hypothetical protein
MSQSKNNGLYRNNAKHSFKVRNALFNNRMPPWGCEPKASIRLERIVSYFFAWTYDLPLISPTGYFYKQKPEIVERFSNEVISKNNPPYRFLSISHTHHKWYFWRMH